MNVAPFNCSAAQSNPNFKNTSFGMKLNFDASGLDRALEHITSDEATRISCREKIMKYFENINNNITANIQNWMSCSNHDILQKLKPEEIIPDYEKLEIPLTGFEEGVYSPNTPNKRIVFVKGVGRFPGGKIVERTGYTVIDKPKLTPEEFVAESKKSLYIVIKKVARGLIEGSPAFKKYENRISRSEFLEKNRADFENGLVS